MPQNCEVLKLNDYRKLPIGSLVHGTVTVDDRKISVEVTVGKGSPELTAEQHLSIIQAQLNGESDVDEPMDEKGVLVEKIELPDKEPTRVLSGTYWRTLEGKQEDSVKEKRTMFNRILGRLGLG